MSAMTTPLAWVLATLFSAALGAGVAHAAQPLACDVQTASECRITTLKTLPSGGTFSVDRALHIAATGELRTAPGTALAIEIAGGLVMFPGARITGDASGPAGLGAAIAIAATGPILLAGDGIDGARISADQTATSCSSGKAGSVTLTSAFAGAGDAVAIQAGARVTANAQCSGGAIEIQATSGKVSIAGLVESVSQRTGPGARVPPGGGPISVTAACDLTVADTGRVSSRGRDPGADLVRVAGGCNVVIAGLVESTGPGHGVPNDPPNHCAGPARPDKPANATACIEIVSGGTLLIDATGSARGEVNADTAQTGGSEIAWIDVVARGAITIKGSGAGPYPADGFGYAVHANQFVSGSRGGLVAVTSASGAVSLAGRAIQADGGVRKATGVPGSGGKGGSVTIASGGLAAAGHVDLGTASIRARGATGGGGNIAGGAISVRSWNGKVLGAAPGELNASGGGTPGSVTLAACAGAEYTGASTPGAVVPAGQCGGSPPLPATVTLPECGCVPPPCEGAACEPPPCEGAACEPSTFCELGTVQAVLHPVTGRFPGNLGPDVVVDGGTGSLQAAVDGATDENGDGYVIVGVLPSAAGPVGGVPAGAVIQQLRIAGVYAKPFALVGCGITVVDPLTCDGIAPIRIAAAAGSPEHPAGSGVHLFVLGITAQGSESAPAWLVEGDGRFLQEVAGLRSLMGFRIVGNDNTLRTGEASENTSDGIAVEGARNTIEGMTVLFNSGDGITVAGNNNDVLENAVGAHGKGNQGDGIHVAGRRNRILDNTVFSNLGDGIDVRGGTAAAPNLIRRNRVGDQFLGNSGHGISVAGTGSGAGGPIEILGNVTQGNGLAGLRVTGSGHELKGNVSGGANKGNAGCEFEVAAGNFNATGNLAGAFAVSGADGSPFPAFCLNF